MIVYVTSLSEMPSNCFECKLSEYLCSLPIAKNGESINKPYFKKKHPKCPLKKVSD